MSKLQNQHRVLPPVQAIVGQGGKLTNFHYTSISLNQIPLQKMGDYLECDAYIEDVAIFVMSSEFIKFLTIGSAPFGQTPIMPRICPYGGMVGCDVTLMGA